jgi:outer membrane protein, heavy metal efflux system
MGEASGGSAEWIFAQEPMHNRTLLAGVVLAGVMHAAPAMAQQAAAPLDSLLARALAVSPTLRSATARVDAARARVRPVSTLPDPMLMAGIVNQPLGRTSSDQMAMTPAGGPDPMTMRMIGVEQTIPYPGKLALRRREAEHDVDASEAAVEAARRQVARDVKSAYFDLAFLERALDIVARNQEVLASLISITESRYSVGRGGQQDVLKARVEATRLAETAAGLMEQRRATLAQLNALLDQPSETPVMTPTIPESIARAAVASASDQIRFVSAALGSRAADSPLRPLGELQDAASRSSPELREQDAMLGAQSARIELARKEHLPDVGLSLQYGQRGGGLPDMVSATISMPVPVFRGRKQDQEALGAAAQLAALQGDREATVLAIRADVARLVSDIERERTRLALSVKAILPQSRAALASASASYQVGKVEFLTVLENQSTVFSYEMDYFRALSDFAKSVAELERVVGEAVLR